MKQIKINHIDEVVYYTKLDNGLDVYLYNKENCTNNYVTFTTRFGSTHNEFIPLDKQKMTKVPNGIAHFLEHKVFVQKNEPQPEDFFAQSGAICNAYTTFKNTTYLFSGPNNLKDNINFLLDYVQEPYFTIDNVNNEKGIITQEINMCNDDPTDVLYEYIRKNSFHNNPFKESIIGTVKDIKQITPETLFTCYETFYHPSNMFLVVTGNFNKEDILDTIVKNQSQKHFKNPPQIILKKYEEPNTVVKTKEIVHINTPVPKIAYSIKIPLNKLNISQRKYNLYLFIIFSILFDDTSKFDEDAKQQNIITNSLYLNILNCDSHLLISLINETNQYEKLINKIESTLQNIIITEEDLERKKRVLISNELFSFENIEIINEMIIDSIIFENKLESDIITIIKSLNKKELDSIIAATKFTQQSIVILNNKQSD